MYANENSHLLNTKNAFFCYLAKLDESRYANGATAEYPDTIIYITSL